jgi:hypothetical protein
MQEQVTYLYFTITVGDSFASGCIGPFCSKKSRDKFVLNSRANLNQNRRTKEVIILCLLTTNHNKGFQPFRQKSFLRLISSGLLTAF